jgi:hypothetical protein
MGIAEFIIGGAFARPVGSTHPAHGDSKQCRSVQFCVTATPTHMARFPGGGLSSALIDIRGGPACFRPSSARAGMLSKRG